MQLDSFVHILQHGKSCSKKIKCKCKQSYSFSPCAYPRKDVCCLTGLCEEECIIPSRFIAFTIRIHGSLEKPLRLQRGEMLI